MNKSPFINRQKELLALHEQFDRARHHGSRLVLLSAPAGMGKTALCQHFGRSLASKAHVFSGRGWDNRAAMPYYALREALTPLYQQHTASIETANPYLEKFFTQTGRANTESAPPSLLFYGLGELLAKVADRPLCILLDDLQWADEGTLEWLDFALHELSEVPILWIGSYRSEETAALAPLLTRNERWIRDGRLSEQVLEPLKQVEVEKIARHVAPTYPWDRQSINAVWQRSNGLPLLVIEEARARATGDKDRPQGQALIRYKLERLDPQDLELLCQAAVLGEQFAVVPLAKALTRDSFAVAQRLDHLSIHEALLTADESGFRFAHSRYREALLDSITPELMRQYHARLTSLEINLDSSQQAYHLIHSGDVQQGARALLEEGDRARGQLAWRDALRYYQEAAQQLRDREGDPELRCSVYERMGDLHLSNTQEPEIARGYYEAAMNWAQTPHQRALLFCRLALAYKLTPRAMHYIEEAARWVSGGESRSLHDWIELQRLTISPHRTPSAEDRRRAYDLARRAAQYDDLPQELADFTQRAISWMSGVLLDEEEIERQSKLLDRFPAHSWSRVQHLSHLIQTYRGCGRIADIIPCAREARTIAQRLGQRTVATAMLCESGFSMLQMGRIEEARNFWLEALSENPSLLEANAIYRLLCQSWLYEPSPQGLEWARKSLRTAEKILAPGENFYRTWLHELGPAESVFALQGKADEFYMYMDKMAARISPYRYGSVCPYLKPRSDAPGSPPVDIVFPRDNWHYTPGHERAEILEQDSTIAFRALPIQGFSHMDMPRALSRIEGDFALQATINSGEQVRSDTFTAWQQIAQGRKNALAAGAGGLLVCRDAHNALRLFAHTCSPGEVLLEARIGAHRETYGRGFVGYGPLRLRLEKIGTLFSAYAAQEDGPWYSCGQIDLPTWNEVEIGLYGENVVALYPALVERAETRFKDVHLQATPATPATPTPIETARALTEPDFALNFPDLVAHSAPMQRVLQQVRRRAKSSISVLIQGETGTGKELVARALHRLSARSDGPFIALNCAAIASELLERELFGHMRGAFTGAYDNRGGLFEAADGGVLFLDEIAEATPAFQARLLRVLEDGAVRRVGAQAERRVDVRVVAASNRDLAAMIEEGSFRRDLYYRLCGATIELSPLRKRRADIEPLVAHSLCQWAQQRETSIPTVGDQALEALKKHDWPGNVRELIHAVEQAAEEADGQMICRKHLSISTPQPTASTGRDEESSSLIDALRLHKGNISAAARQLGISRPTLYRRLREAGIRAMDYK